MKREIRNARIESASIQLDRGVFLSCWLALDYGGSGQGFGGYVLGRSDTDAKGKALDRVRETEGANYAGVFICAVMRVAEVEKFSDLVGKTIRVDCEHSKVHGIGHILKDDWFYPEEEMKRLRGDFSAAGTE